MEAGKSFESSAYSKGVGSRATIANDSETLFSSKDFVKAWSVAFPEQRLRAIPVLGCGLARKMYAIQINHRYRSRYIQMDLWDFMQVLDGMVNWKDRHWRESLIRLCRSVQGDLFGMCVLIMNLWRRLVFVRLESGRVATQMLRLNPMYDRVFADYSATIRNHIRKAYRRGIRVREATSAGDIRAYHSVHLRLAGQKWGYRFTYPIELFFALTEIHGAARLLIAEVDEKVVAGGLFFRDGNSVMYWHGASDRAYSHLYPSCAVLDRAISWACEVGATFFNFGGSAGIDSLERFKSTWGARRELNWTFQWENPLWARLGRVKEKLTH